MCPLFRGFTKHLWNTAWQVLTYGVFSGLYFPKFGLNAEIFRGDPRFQSQYKIKDQKKLCIWTLFTQWSSLKVTIVETIGFLFRSSRLHVFYQKFALKNIWKYSESRTAYKFIKKGLQRKNLSRILRNFQVLATGACSFP